MISLLRQNSCVGATYAAGSADKGANADGDLPKPSTIPAWKPPRKGGHALSTEQSCTASGSSPASASMIHDRGFSPASHGLRVPASCILFSRHQGSSSGRGGPRDWGLSWCSASGSLLETAYATANDRGVAASSRQLCSACSPIRITVLAHMQSSDAHPRSVPAEGKPEMIVAIARIPFVRVSPRHSGWYR